MARINIDPDASMSRNDGIHWQGRQMAKRVHKISNNIIIYYVQSNTHTHTHRYTACHTIRLMDRP